MDPAQSKGDSRPSRASLEIWLCSFRDERRRGTEGSQGLAGTRTLTQFANGRQLMAGADAAIHAGKVLVLDKEIEICSAQKAWECLACS